MDDFLVNDDTGSANQWYPSIASDNSRNSIIAWTDLRSAQTNIYMQKYDSSGIPLGSNFRVNDVPGSAILFSPPTVAMGSSNKAVIAWVDERYPYDSYLSVYAQRYDSTGTPVGSNFAVWVGVYFEQPEYLALAMDGFGNFIIVWQVLYIEHNASYYILAQRFDSLGDSLGGFRVDLGIGSAEERPAVCMDKVGNFVIAWESGSHYIYARRYDSSGAALSTACKVNTGGGFADHPAIAINSSGYFVITWEHIENGNFDIYAQRYDTSGSPLDSNFKVNDDVDTASQQNPAIAMDGTGNFVIVWEDYRNGQFKPTVYAQKYNSDGNPSGSNLVIPNSQYSSFQQEYPSVSVNDNNIYFAWMDNRRAKGWDIYAKVVNWDWSDVTEEQQENMPNSYELSQNYPNPFNPTTVIRYSISSHHLTHSTITIYNILGQKLRTLVNEPKSTGTYEVIWDGKDDKGKDVSSGIYFYQLKVGNLAESKKMLLLR